MFLIFYFWCFWFLNGLGVVRIVWHTCSWGFQWCCFFCLTVWHTCVMWVLTQEWSIPLSRIVSLIAGGILRGDWDAPSHLLKLLVGIDRGMLCHVDDQWQMMTDCQTLTKNERELIMPIFQEKETSTFSHCLMGVNHRIHRKMDWELCFVCPCLKWSSPTQLGVVTTLSWCFSACSFNSTGCQSTWCREVIK